MKKKLIIILTSISIVLISCNKYFFEILIESQLSKFTEHKVKLNLKKINLFSGTLELKEIQVQNKENFFNPNIFVAEKILIEIDPNTYFSDLVIIKKLSFYKPRFFFEIKNIDIKNKKNIKKDNLEILDKLNTNSKPKIYPKKKKDKNFIIIDLEINNATAYIKYKINEENLIIPLSEMNFSKVGNAGNDKIKFQHYKDIMKFILYDVFFRIPDQKLRNLIKKNYNIQ